MYPAIIQTEKYTVSCSETLYQMAKSRNPEEQNYIATLNGYDAKKYWRGKELPANWQTLKFLVMTEVVWLKFSQNKDLAQLLLMTGNCAIVEGNTWHDNDFGVCSCKKCENKEKHNMLGKILMNVRNELLNGSNFFK